jgi:hypothetical protein
MPKLLIRPPLLARCIVIALVAVAAFWLGRLSSQSTAQFSLAASRPAPTTHAGENDLVPIDPLKLDNKTLRIVNTVCARQIPIDLYRRANELALFDLDHDAGHLRDSLRDDLRNGVRSLALGAQGWGVTGLNESALRQVSTYYDAIPDQELDPSAKAWLTKFPPYSRDELVNSQCENSICTLARVPATRSAR